MEDRNLLPALSERARKEIDRNWEQWAKDVAIIAENFTARIKNLIDTQPEKREQFDRFIDGLHSNINPSIDENEAVAMLAQHIITRPVFDALFEGYSFVNSNPVSVSMQMMLNYLQNEAYEKDLEPLQKFYDSVRKRASGIDNAEGKQRIILELYNKFFKTAFPKMVERLGIVYTPVEVVDFIIHSVNDVMKAEFNRSLADDNVHILEPFAGTGTFITRLIQSGIIPKDRLPRKYQNEIFAYEILLLAYYICAVNIENAYHDALGSKEYQSFNGICLTDTFQITENDHSNKLFSDTFPHNSERVESQRKTPLRVIIGNPPYSVGQKSANDNAQNLKYPKLDKRIAETYAKLTDATNKKSLYDSYIKAFRWSSDRLDKENGGIICFISNGGWLDGNAMTGFRKCLEMEFTAIYVFNLRGNQRTSGELSRKEGGKIFGSGSRTPVTITLLVKKPAVTTGKATIHYRDIGDYLSREQKLDLIIKSKSVLAEPSKWTVLQPDEHGDWLTQRNDQFATFIPLGDKDDKNNKATFFVPLYGRGLTTARDAWVFDSKKESLITRITDTIAYYNSEVDRFAIESKTKTFDKIEDFIIPDSTKFSWDRQQRFDVAKQKKYKFEINSIYKAVYRPFCKQWVYFNRQLNNCVYQLPQAFPLSTAQNLVICVTGNGATKDFSVMMTDCIPDGQLQFNGQCFPLYYYEPAKEVQGTLALETGDGEGGYIRRDGVSDFILARAKSQYGSNVTKEDIFYYVYGFLHCPTYRETFANDLKKMLPRLPLVEDMKDFWAFSQAGRALAKLHVDYETVPPYKGVTVTGAESGFFKVEKMRFLSKDRKDTIQYNSKITISNIPAKAYEYIVNGKSAIDWIMERYAITTHKDSGIINDPNDWAEEVGNPRYILDLLLSVIHLSIQTVDIVNALPAVKFESE